MEQPVLTAVSGPGGHTGQCSSSPRSHGSGDDNSWVISVPDSQDLLTQTSQTQTVLKGRGGAREGPGSPSQAPGRMPPCSSSPTTPPLPPGNRGPPRPWLDSRRCATCQLLEPLPAKLAARSLCLQCHQSFLLCVLDQIQGSRGSCGSGEESPDKAGRGGCSHSGRGPRPLGREHTPISRGPRRHASPCSQTAGRQICTSIYKVLEFSPGCHTVNGA